MDKEENIENIFSLAKTQRRKGDLELGLKIQCFSYKRIATPLGLPLYMGKEKHIENLFFLAKTQRRPELKIKKTRFYLFLASWRLSERIGF